MSFTFWSLLHLVPLLCLTGYVLAAQPGTEFAVVFMQNAFPDFGEVQLEVQLTAFFPNTQASIQTSDRSYNMTVSVNPRQPLTVALPDETEILGSTRANKTVHITSSAPIMVVATSRRSKETTVVVVSPVEKWGNEYYAMTPDFGPEDSFGQVAIVNGPNPNVVSILLQGTVEFENNLHYAGNVLILSLEPWEAIQLQTKETLTGSYLVSEESVAVFSGHTCAALDGPCSQALVQLPPVSAWGFKFVVPSFLNYSHIIYILAESQTEVKIRNGTDTHNQTIIPGLAQEMNVDSDLVVQISSTGRLLVLVYINPVPYNGFLLDLLPVEINCSLYSIVALGDFTNAVELLVKADEQYELQINNDTLVPSWMAIPGTELVHTYARIDGEISNFIYNPGSHLSVVSFGISMPSLFESTMPSTYGASGVCMNDGEGPFSSLGEESALRTQQNLGTGKVAGTILNGLSESECFNASICQSGCQKNETQSCMVWGRTYFRTFQGMQQFYTGSCPTVLIASQGDDSSLGPFSVERKPENFTVRVKMFGETLEISAAKPNRVLVNGKQKYAPITLQDGRLNITRFGLSFLLKASFGLSLVIGDYDGFLHIQMPGSYSKNLSGLCVKQNLAVLSTPGELRHQSWIMTNWSAGQGGLNCDLGSLVNAEPCVAFDEVFEVPHACHLMMEYEIFQACHSTLDPTPFMESCGSEAYKQQSVCLALEAYALACEVEGINMTGWRSQSQCALQCPPNSHYQACPSACQSSCWEGQDTNCDPHSCYEACICEGHLKLSAWGTCVPPGECGCAFEDGYYPPGKEFMLETCTTQCRCNVSNVDCHEVQPCDVGLGYTCEQDDDEFICVPHSLVSCSLYGDSHYVRFDGKDLPRNGFCQPTVAVICTPHSGLEFFHVQMVQDRQNVPHSTAVNIVVFGKNITLNPESGHVAVDGTLVQTPYIEGNLLKIIRSGLQGFLLQSAFGLVVSYDQTGHLLVRIPESYSRGVCGLCSPVNLTSNFPCSDQCQGIRYSCSVDDIVLHRSPDYCGQLDVADGLFSNCYEQVHPMAYIEACVADLCNQTTLCSSFSSYVSACQEAGVSMEEWRSQTSCDYKCPPNSYYSLCAPSCPPVCGVSLPESCPLPCREGCVCEEGYILRDDTCVPYEGCGCYVDGQYMDAGEKFYTDQCRKECTCSGNLICNDHTCTDEEECKTVQGIRACYPKLPTCWVSGQTYHTFDGATFTAEGECLRTLLTTKCPTTELPAATDVEVQMRRLLDPESNLAVLQDSKLKISGYTILLNEDNDGVEVDGFLTPFPYSWPGMVNIAGNYTHTRIEAESGLNLIIDPSKVSITLKPPYLGNVCGLCGNANGNPSDDFENLTEDEFVSNWISYYSDEPKPFSLGMYCKLMVRVDGPFQECQLFLDAYQYYGSCLTSACSDSKEDVCQALRNFYSDCQATGATVYQWEQETTCASEGPSSTLPISLNETRVSSNSSQMASPIQPVEGCHLPLNGSFNDLYKSEGKYNCTFKIAETYSQDRNGSGWDRSIDCKLLVLGSIGTATNLSFSVSLQHIVEANRSVSNLIAEGYGMQVMLPLIADNQVLVNGVPTNIPACLSSNIKVWVDDYDFILETDSGLVVSYNPDGHLVVLVPAALQDQLLGQCAEGAGVHLLNFSREWNAKPDQCLSGVKEPFSCEVHHTGCDIFLVANGPFKDCSNLIDPKTYHQNCQKHFCESGGNEASVCNFLQASTSRCHEHGALVRPWRNETFCPFPCPEKAIYEVCTEPCRMCQGRLCPSLYCQEGCNCTDGLLWDGRNCVAPEVCGKNQTKPNLYPNKYLNCMNDSSLQPNCRLCSVDNTSISTFGYISGEHNGNGTYDVVKICDSLAEEKWRISLALTPPLPPQLSIHFNNFSIAVNTDLDVLVDGKNESLPVIVASNLYLEKTEGGFSLGWPGKMVLTFNPLGQLNIYAFQNVAAELCGACSIANSYQGDGEIFYLDPWKAEDL